MTEKYDVIVIGAGPGGMTAALYASRANLKVAMLDRGIYGGQMNNTAEVENYPGFKSIMGPELAKKMYESSTQFGAKLLYGSVTGITVDENGTKHVKTDSDEYEAEAVIIATGSESRKLGVPGEENTAAAAFHTVPFATGHFTAISASLSLAAAILQSQKACILPICAKTSTLFIVAMSFARKRSCRIALSQMKRCRLRGTAS